MKRVSILTICFLGSVFAEEKPPLMHYVEDDATITVKRGDAPIFKYNKIPTEEAALHEPVFTRSGYIHPVYSPDGKEPYLYSSERTTPDIPFRNIPGDYTRYGLVDPLLSSGDDHFVIFGRGDEIALEFDAAALPPCPRGTGAPSSCARSGTARIAMPTPRAPTESARCPSGP